MKKNLLLTTALVAVSFAASNAWAEDKNTPEKVSEEKIISDKTFEEYKNGAIEKTTDLTVENSHFNNNAAGTRTNGGAIFSTGTLNVEKSTFKGNKAEGNLGGAIVATGKTTITDSDFGAGESGEGNKAKSGGAIFNQGEMTIKGGSFSKNEASESGGAIYSNSTGMLSITDVDFSENKATGNYGGAIAQFNTKGNMTVTGGSFNGNEAKQRGGAIFSQGILSINNSKLNNNSTEQYGGALFAFGKTDIKNTDFTGNSSKGNGGAIYNGSNMTLTGGTFSGNQANGDAKKTGDGGAVYSQANTSLTIDNVTFKNNTSNHVAGAVFSAGETNITDGSFDDNQAAFLGGAIYAYKGTTLNIDGTNFNRNKVEINKGTGQGGAIYSEASSSIKNATFDGNVAVSGGAVFSKDGGLNLENTIFKNNSAKETTANLEPKDGFGGAVLLTGDTQDKKNEIKNAIFTNNSADIYGGALYTEAGLDISDSTFSKNSAKYGGASTFSGSKKVTVTNNIFEENNAEQGGAIYTVTDLDISNSEFSKNSADLGGSMVIGDKTVKMTNNVFENNTATSQGGAILITLGADSQPKADVTAEGSIFRGNSSQMGGAITNFSKLSLKNSSFTNNKAITEGSDSDLGSGGAMFLGSSSTTNLEEVTFSGNTSSKNGGAIGTRETIDNPNLKLAVNGATFTDNHADGEGGALYLGKKAKASFDGGEIVFANNTDKNGLNDIALSDTDSELTVKQGVSLSLDGGISGQGKLKLEKGSSLNVKDTTNIEAKTSVENGTGLVANLNVVVTGKTTKSGKLALYGTKDSGAIFSAQDNEAPLSDLRFDTAKNNLFDFDTEDEGKTYTVEAKSTREIAKVLGVNNTEASTLLAVSSTESTGNTKLDSVLSTLQETSQYGDGSEDLSKEADALGADAAPVVRTHATMLSNMIFDTADEALSNTLQNATVGQSSGDSVFEKAKVWVKGLFNYADKDDTSKAHGFDMDTYGAAMGVDKEVGNGKVGLGYAYSESDIDGYTRNTDVKTHTAFVYGQYQPADWYVKGVAAYSWSDYKEKKSVLGENADSKYDVDTLALQGMFGYNFHVENDYDVTPEAGLRYLRASQDASTNALGVRVKARDIDVLTAVAGVKVAKNFALTDSLTIRPEVRAALTYDLDADNNDSIVTMGNTSYRVNGEKLERFGYELGAKLATDITSQWEVSAGYEGRFRDDYQDHSGILSAKYKF